MTTQAALDYEQSVQWHLDLIQRSQTGQALVRAIQRTGQQLTIKPYPDFLAKKDPFNADTKPLDPRAATPAGEYVLGQFKTKKQFNVPFVLTGGRSSEPLKGTGQGSGVVIFYSPSMWGFGGSAASTYAPTSPGFGPSAVLFHEMVHAYRDMRGTSTMRPTMGGRTLYNNEEEFFAILVCNIFVTDPTTAVLVRTLRADHSTLNALVGAQSTSQGFLQVAGNLRLIMQFCAQEPGLTNDLAQVNAGFNPIKQYYKQANPNFTP